MTDEAVILQDVAPEIPLAAPDEPTEAERLALDGAETRAGVTVFKPPVLRESGWSIVLSDQEGNLYKGFGESREDAVLDAVRRVWIQKGTLSAIAWARVSARGHWHAITKLSDSGSSYTACGRVLPRVEVGERTEGAALPPSEKQCEKCAARLAEGSSG